MSPVHETSAPRDASKTVRDPVCNMLVDPLRTPHSTVHEGQTIHFCAAKCREKFEADPARYLAPVRVAEVPERKDVVYVCPMDPEVRQMGPGSCPQCGMALEPEDPVAASVAEDQELSSMWQRFLVAAALTVPILVLAMGSAEMGWVVLHRMDMRVSQWLQFVLCLPVIAWSGFPFFERGWQSVANRKLNMFTLIAMGTGAAFGFSLFALLFPEAFPAALQAHHGGVEVYFESAAVIVTLVLLGQVLELRARRETASAIRGLMRLVPETAVRLRADGTQEVVSISVLKRGDVLRIRPGDRVPVDGAVTAGEGSLDESMLTGEPMPVAKALADTVVGGTINLSGSFLMRATAVGETTVLARIVAMVAQAQRSRAPIQQLVDRVSAWFVPAVVAVSLFAFLGWMLAGPEPRLSFAVVAAVSVLVIACPCALGLATPMSIMVGVGRGAQSGVLVRHADSLERLEKVSTLVVDKTGTLTVGRPVITHVEVMGDLSRDELVGLVAAVEQASAHPLAAALVRAAMETGRGFGPVSGFVSYPGAGIEGRVEGRRVVAGNLQLMERLMFYDDASRRHAMEVEARGQSTVYVAVDGRMAGAICLSDPVKPTARPALDELRARGLKIVMLTGDSSTAAARVAQAVGIEEVFAGLSPDGKLREIRARQQRGEVVAMAGDGINDAPALAAADVGIAMGSGTDVAIESAGLTMIKGDLRGIVRAHDLARAVMTNIRQNLFLAFFYNAVGVLVAAGLAWPLFGALLSPGIAAGAMSLSSVSVIANALRLRRLRL
jgi:Cu+-exporting ATPase